MKNIEINQKYRVTEPMSQHFQKEIIIVRKAEFPNSLYDFYYIVIGENESKEEYPFALDSIFSNSLRKINS